MIMAGIRHAAVAAALVTIAAAGAPASAETPAATKALIKALHLKGDVLQGWEEEQKVPADWIAKARKEGTVRVYGSWNNKEFRKMSVPFQERYPFIKLVYARGNSTNRVEKPLIAFKEGNYIADLITGIGGSIYLFREAGALLDLRVLPNFKNIPEGMGSQTGIWAGLRTRYWCMSYNTTLMKKSDMPKRWEDLLTAPKLKDGKLALGRLPQLWLMPLWGTRGEAWTTDYMSKIFSEVRPQRRKEGMNALVSLVAAGEFNAAVASADYRVAYMRKKGAPVAWHCPTPVPVAISEGGILKGSPNQEAAMLYMNWLLSKEGQLSQFHTSAETPVHKDLMNKGFVSFPDELKGKPIAFRSPELLGNDTEKNFFVTWHRYWDDTSK